MTEIMPVPRKIVNYCFTGREPLAGFLFYLSIINRIIYFEFLCFGRLIEVYLVLDNAHFFVSGDRVVEGEYACGVTSVISKACHKRYGAVYLRCKVGKIIESHTVGIIRTACTHSSC